MNDLFIQAPQFEKVAYKRVSENPSEWIANVMEAFYNQFPSFSNSKVNINFTQKEEAKGYAIGQITVEEGTGMTVPIIIKDRELYPFDVAIVGGNAMPLTNVTIQMYLENRGAFWRTVKPEAGDITNALFNTSFSQSITPTYMHETYKQAEYNINESMREESMRTSLRDRLSTQIVMDPRPEEVTITGLSKGKTPLPQDLMLKKMEEQALTGGQVKANEIFMQMVKDHQMRQTDSLLYMMLSFKKWAGEQGMKTSGWDVPGFEKSAGVADWFFEEDVNFLSKQTGLKHQRLSAVKKNSPDEFAKLYQAAKKHVEGGGSVRSLVALSDPTQSQLGKMDSNPQPAGGVTAMSKAGEFLIEKIAPTITQEMKTAFFDTLQKDASVVEGFKQNGTANVVLKIAAVNPQPVDFNEKVRQELERDIHYVYKNASHEYTGIFGNSQVADPIRIVLDDEAAKKFESIKTAAVTPTQLEKQASTQGHIVTEKGRQYAILNDGSYTEIPFSKTADLKSSAIPTSFYTEPCVAKNSAFVVEGKVAEIVEVTRVWSENNQERIETFNGLEKKAYSRMKGIDEPHTEGGITYLPISTKFVKLGECVVVPEKILDNPLLNNTITKTAANQYVLEGRVFSEMLRKEGSVHDMHTTVWHGIQAGMRKEDLEKIALLEVNDVLPIKYDLRIPHSLDKVASIMNAQYEKDASIIVDVAKNLIKEAAAFNDQQTVDAVLSLNFVNKNNIMEFVEALPMFAQVGQKLADMLLKTRLGVTLLDEVAIRKAMLGIVEIMDVLNGVQNLLEKK